MTRPSATSDTDPPAGQRRRDLDARLDAAGTIARRAGQRAVDLRSAPTSLEIKEKGLQDFVTRADVEVETLVRDTLLGAFPDDGFLGEESTRRDAAGDAGTWVVDPIDGTSNYIRGIRHWGVSIAYVQHDRVEIGAIYDAPNQALYLARRGGGATRNGRPIAVSTTAEMGQALVILGMSRRMALDDYLDDVRLLTREGADYRRFGSAAIGLARVAEGVADLYFEVHLNSWDALAGMLLVHEAGGGVKAIGLATMLADGGAVLADNGLIGDRVAFLSDDKEIAAWPR